MRRGFSLVELSIVLVILGLLVGGVMVGQSLIRASELRSVGTSAERYKTAIYAFRDKYMGLPGDFDKAESFWGTWSTSGTAASVAGAKNGNNDRAYGVTADRQYERAQFWRHLAFAGLIEGSYAGSYAEPTMVWEPGTNVPALKIGGRAGVNSVTSASASKVYGTMGDYLIMQGNTSPYHILTPTEAWNIDAKGDDGNPSQGGIMGIAEGTLAARNCTTNDDWQNAAVGPGASTYKLAVTSVECWPLFWIR